ncbi:Glycoside hydrolase, family 47 [Cynara cardunculus var. scolymus]|uniref:Glycoside hydrolase, family 47 n=1 Tax=Cynara cardunculus var. scolymus TaxID=59895 RepID=A0A103XBV1_CYNCS|nr:Glycoside hydrolase, family 47 [Cynara cardunculus var. scolymus]
MDVKDLTLSHVKSHLQHGQKSYPLRPELIESTYWLYKATRDPSELPNNQHTLGMAKETTAKSSFSLNFGKYCG